MKRVALLTSLVVIASSVLVRAPRSPRLQVGSGALQLVKATVVELQLALRSRLVTSEQLVHMYLDRIATYHDAGPVLNSFIQAGPAGCRRGARTRRALRRSSATRSFGPTRPPSSSSRAGALPASWPRAFRSSWLPAPTRRAPLP